MVAFLVGHTSRVASSAWETLRFVPDCLILFKRLLADARVPRRAKVALGLTIAYLALPFDLVPDFIPIIGQLDDVVLVIAMVGYVVKRTGEPVVRELWPGSQRGLDGLLRLAA